MEYTFISMRHISIQINLPFTFPTDQEFHPSKEDQKTAIGDVLNPTIISDDPSLMFTTKETPKHPSNEEHSDDVMFNDDNTSVGAILILTSFKSL